MKLAKVVPGHSGRGGLALTAATLYFMLVFAMGVLLGAIRTLWMVPRFGARTSELVEMPFMVLISFIAASRIIHGLAIPFLTSLRLQIGFIALCFMLVAEFVFGFKPRELSMREYLDNIDMVPAIAYYAALGIFSLMPLLVARSVPSQTRRGSRVFVP